MEIRELRHRIAELRLRFTVGDMLCCVLLHTVRHMQGVLLGRLGSSALGSNLHERERERVDIARAVDGTERGC